jgi:hypothetical protein
MEAGVRPRELAAGALLCAACGISGGNEPPSPAPAQSEAQPVLPRTLPLAFATALRHLPATRATLEFERDHYRSAGSGAHFELRIPKRADAAFRLEQRASELAVAVSLKGATAVAPDVSGGFALFVQGGPNGSTLLLGARDHGVEDLVEIDEPSVTELHYEVTLERVAGLRHFDDMIEFLSADGSPKIRVSPPYVVDANGRARAAHLDIAGCAYDTSPRLPWGRALTAPGAQACEVVVSFRDQGLTYPLVVDPVWALSEDMMVPRVWHTATPLPADGDNRAGVLVVGGRDNYDLPLQTSEFYDEETSSWTAAGSFDVPRFDHTATRLLDESVLVVGGSTALDEDQPDETNPITSVVRYRRGSGWSKGPSLPLYAPRTQHTATRLSDGSVVVIGGGGLAALTLPQPHDSNSSQDWAASEQQMQASRFRHTAVLSNGRVFVMGGTPGLDTGDPLASVEAYDPGTGNWEALPDADMNAGRAGHTATLLPGVESSTTPRPELILVVGNNSSPQLFDPLNRKWLDLDFTSHPVRNHHAAVVLSKTNDIVLVIGGENGSQTEGTSEVFNRIGDEWTDPSGDLQKSRRGHTATVLSDGRTVLVVGGSNNLTGAVYSDGELTTAGTPGDPCDSDDDCVVGSCTAEHVCCDQPCDKVCQACTVARGAEVDGTCQLRKQGVACGQLECHEAATCNGRSPQCPQANPLDDGTSCMLGEHDSGVCSSGTCVESAAGGVSGGGGEAGQRSMSAGGEAGTGGRFSLVTGGSSAIEVGGSSAGETETGGSSVTGSGGTGGTAGPSDTGGAGGSSPHARPSAFACSLKPLLVPGRDWLAVVSSSALLAFLLLLRRGVRARRPVVRAMRHYSIRVLAGSLLVALGSCGADDDSNYGDTGGTSRGGSGLSNGGSGAIGADGGKGGKGVGSGRGGTAGTGISSGGESGGGESGQNGQSGFAGSEGGQFSSECGLSPLIVGSVTPIGDAMGPSERRSSAMAEAKDGVVLFGGVRTGGLLDDTWFRGADSTWLKLASGPPARSGHALATLGDGALMFGGIGTDGALGDTWLWHESWTLACEDDICTDGPGARFAHALSSDLAGNDIVLFGGTDGTSAFDDTWTWTSDAGWAHRCGTPPGGPIGKYYACGPSARFDHALAYDAANHLTVLYGGNDGSGDLDDVWTFDGKHWQKQTIAGPGPGARSGHVMAYDSHLRVLIVLGGTGPLGPLDGWALSIKEHTWTPLALRGSVPSTRSFAAFAFDGSEFVLHGGGTAIAVGDGSRLSFGLVDDARRCACRSACGAACSASDVDGCTRECELGSGAVASSCTPAAGGESGGGGSAGMAGEGGTGTVVSMPTQPECKTLWACCSALSGEPVENCRTSASIDDNDTCGELVPVCRAQDGGSSCFELGACCAHLTGALKNYCFAALEADACDEFLRGGYCAAAGSSSP